TPMTIPVYAAPRALMIVGSVVNMNLSDLTISNRLDLLGYEVSPLSATTANRRAAAAANGMSLIYVSSTAGTAIGATFRDVKVPTIVARRELMANYDIVPSNNGTNLGIASVQSQLNVVNAAHPLA